MERKSEYFASIHEGISSIPVIKIYSLQDYFRSRFDNNFSQFLDSVKSLQKLSYTYESIDKVVSLLAKVVIYVICFNELMKGKIEIGEVIVIFSYFNSVLASIQYFFSLGETIQSTRVSFERIMKIYNQDVIRNGTLVIDRINELELESIQFSYGKKVVLNDISIKMIPNNIYLIEGENGKGKTTLLNIINGLFQNEFYGSVKFNGYNMNVIDVIKLRKHCIGRTSQDPVIIKDTLLNNIILNEKSVTRDRVISYLEKFGEIKLVNRLDKICSEDDLSVGEKQKISIIRQLIKNPDLMIFDEPTAALDSESKIVFVESIKKIAKGKIIIIITHDEKLKLEATDIIRI